MIKVGIIGCGKIANSHMQVLMEFDEAVIAAVCDLDKNKRQQATEKTGAVEYSGYEEMLENENLDLVVICLPPALHGKCTIYCAEKGVNVFIEKPMGIDITDCKAMIRACRENGVLLWVGHMQRYSQENRIAKDLIASGEYGELVSINEVRSCAYPSPNSPGWLMNRAIAGGGIMYNFGAHTLDMIKYLTESKLKIAESSVHFTEGDSENIAVGFLKMENGVSATFNLVGSCAVNRYEIVLYLTKGEIRIEPRKSISVCGIDGVFKKISENENTQQPTLKNSWQYMQMRDVLDAVKNREVKVSGEYGLEIIECIEKLYSSAGRK